MQSNGYQAPHPEYYNGGINGNSSSSINGAQPLRPFSVEEALPYSPLSSIVPFNSALIPTPSIGLQSSASLFMTEHERQLSRQGIEFLNQEFQGSGPNCESFQRFIKDAQDLLRPEDLTTFKFNVHPARPILTPPSEQSSYNISLSPSAQALLNNTKVSYRLVTPKSPLRTPNGNTIREVQKPRSPLEPAKHRKPIRSTPPIQQFQQQNQQAHLQNDTIDPSVLMMATATPVVSHMVTPRASPPLMLPTSNVKAEYAVILPPASETIRKEDYVKFSDDVPSSTPSVILPHPSKLIRKEDYVKFDDDAPTAMPSKILPQIPEDFAKKDYERFDNDTSTSMPSILLPQASEIINKADYIAYPQSPATSAEFSSIRKKPRAGLDIGDFETSDQREKADQAFVNLRNYVLDIFEAEDQLQPDSTPTGEFFIGHDNVNILTSTVQAKVELLLQKMISLGTFGQVPLDDLLRLQKLCEPSIRIAESEDIKIDGSIEWYEDDAERWLNKLNVVEAGIRAARTSLRIMTGEREEQQLCSEETIKAALSSLRTVVESVVIPVVELRPSGSGSGLFKLLLNQKKVVTVLMNQCRRLLALFNELISKVELSETAIVTLEYLVSKLVFVENAHTEKESLLGVQKFDAFRVVAMDILAQIFSTRPEQRQGIFDEILTSLEKLPATKQSARQFKLLEGGSIQLVSALIMRLIQTSACDNREADERRVRKIFTNLDDEVLDKVPPTNGSSAHNARDPNDTERRAEHDPLTAVQALKTRSGVLFEKAKQNAQYVATFIINRAMGSTKSGDSPYRNLLDLFVQDFITCLGSADWPAAELLLRCILFRMVSLAETDKTVVNAKNMALDLLGEMSAAISQLTSHVRSTVNALDTSGEEADVAKYLAKVAEIIFDSKIAGSEPIVDIVRWSGPFRISLEYLNRRSADDQALKGAIGYRSVDWASQICSAYDTLSSNDLESPSEKEFGQLAYRLRMMIQDPNWLATEYTFKSVESSHARLAYSLTILASDFCRSSERILMILLSAMSSEQATVRSKSLRSVTQVLETDPTILDRASIVLKLIMRSASDSSVQVRESALGLIGKCIGLRPAIEESTIPEILQRASDSGTTVRRKAIRLLKDIYLRNAKEDIRSAIADALLHRVTDLDEGIQEIARTTIEEIWIAPFYLPKNVEDNSAQYKLRVTDHVRLMAKTVNRTSGATNILDKVLHSILSSDTKNAVANGRVCKTFVTTMFDSIIDTSVQGSGELLMYRDSLQLLMIFAKADPHLFTADQIQLLEPYSKNLKSKDDLLVFRAVVVIWRHVFPQLSAAHTKFLQLVRGTLLSSMQKLSKALMDDVVACLWIISSALNDKQNLATLTKSALIGISRLKATDMSKPASTEKAKLLKLCLIVGLVGKHCDLDSESGRFQDVFKTIKGNSIAKLIVDVVVPYASPSQPLDVRLSALDAVGMVSQSWPRNFSSVNVYTTFQQAFEQRDEALEAVILRSFNEFLKLEEKRAEPTTEIPVGAAIETKATLGVMGGTQHDGVSLEIAHKFLEDITRIALATQDDHALLATEILTSINRQGLNHPKECGPALVALETSRNKAIADMAFREHRALHEKHETIMEKEYMRAVQAAFNYQRDVVKDTHGAIKEESASKLAPLLDVLKISKPKSRKRFFESLCARIDFEPAKLDVSRKMPYHVEFAQFIVENLAFFDYATVDDLIAALSAMEKVVAGTGSGIAHAIETELFNVVLEERLQPTVVEGMAAPLQFGHTMDPKRLRQLTAGSMILSSLWEARTYLRRLYGLLHTTHKKDPKSKAKDRDTSKSPVKAQGITSDKLWHEFARVATALASEDAMRDQCKYFVELLSVDKDFKAAAEGDEDAAVPGRFTTPSDDEIDPGASINGSGGGRKRKGSSTPGGRKKRQRSASVSRGPIRLEKRIDTPGSEDAEGEWE